MKARYTIGCLAILAACSTDPLAVSGSQGQTITLAVRQELDLTVGTVGPGEYQSPPAISSPALRFLHESVVPPPLPSGVRQQFRFRAVGPGTALIVITHSGGNPTIQDTVIIQ